MKELQRILSRVRSATDKYHMIEAGDKIAVGVSGGKDSLTLLCALAEMRSFYPVPYEIMALQIDMGFSSCEAAGHPSVDHTEVRELCRRLGVEYAEEPTEISHIIFDLRMESNPCALCAKMRRGALHRAAIEHGCNKLALGHHYDDAVETLMLNLFFGGHYGSFSPVTYLSRRDFTVIRPLIHTEEKMIRCFVKHALLPVEESPCPANGNTERAAMKEYLRQFDREHRGLYARLMGSLERSGVDGWKESAPSQAEKSSED